jgi:hypothetical protein
MFLIGWWIGSCAESMINICKIVQLTSWDMRAI